MPSSCSSHETILTLPTGPSFYLGDRPSWTTTVAVGPKNGRISLPLGFGYAGVQFYHCGSSNGNADALSRGSMLHTIKPTPVTITSARGINNSLQLAQQKDSILQQVHKALLTLTEKPTDKHLHQSPCSGARLFNAKSS